MTTVKNLISEYNDTALCNLKLIQICTIDQKKDFFFVMMHDQSKNQRKNFHKRKVQITRHYDKEKL